jgi:penicillin-binding protein 1A
LRVDTTLDEDLQQTANRAVEDGVATYERRHSWKGRLENVFAGGLSTGPEANTTLKEYRHPDWAVGSGPGDYVHALVTRVLPLEIHARIGGPNQPDADVILLPADWQWTGQRTADVLVKPGDLFMFI